MADKEAIWYVVYYLCHLLLVGKEVVIGQVHHVGAGDDGQDFSQVVAVWEIQVKHIAHLRVLSIGKREEKWIQW